MAENAEKVFEKFLELSPKLRTEIIDEMAPNERCRFTRCSKLSNQEAKASKNYIYGLNIFCNPQGVVVTLKFDLAGRHERSIVYKQKPAKIKKRCLTMDHRILWSVELDSSKTLDEYVNEDVASILHSHGSIIRLFIPQDLSMRNLNINIELLTNLKYMVVTGNTDLLDILSRLPKPLKHIRIDEVEDNARYKNCEEIYQIEEFFIWKEGCFNNQQFLRISASEIIINIGKLTERDIFSFIRSWQNGTIRKNIEYCEWYWKESDFDKEKLARLLHFSEFHINPEVDEYEFELEIQHFNEPGNSALLMFTEESAIFNTTILR